MSKLTWLKDGDVRFIGHQSTAPPSKCSTDVWRLSAFNRLFISSTGTFIFGGVQQWARTPKTASVSNAGVAVLVNPLTTFQPSSRRRMQCANHRLKKTINESTRKRCRDSELGTATQATVGRNETLERVLTCNSSTLIANVATSLL